MNRCLIIVDRFRWATAMPNLSNSPWIRGAPQPLSTDGAPAALADALVIGGDPSALIAQ